MQSGSGSSTGSDLFSNYEQHPPPPGSRLAQYLHGNSTQQVPRPSGWASRKNFFSVSKLQTLNEILSGTAIRRHQLDRSLLYELNHGIVDVLI